MALMLMQRDATVCICHARTCDLAQFTRFADILVVAAGSPNLIPPHMVKTSCVVIDVGITRLPNWRLIGDVDFEGVRQKASIRSRRHRSHDGVDAARQYYRVGQAGNRAV